MNTENYILVQLFCTQTKIEKSFIANLNDYGFIALTTIENETYILEEEITEVERLYRLHYELGINLEGIDALNNLMQKISDLENENRLLKQKLLLFDI
jgi:hypothetical protein